MAESDDAITEDSLSREFPGWRVWEGVSGLWYARWLGSSPPIVVKGGDLTDLRDQIMREVIRHQQRTGCS
jgi:hypothetical protein